MHLPSIRRSLVLLSLIPTGAFADPQNMEPKAWSCGTAGIAAFMAEAEPNDDCPGQVIQNGTAIDPAALDPGEEDWYFVSANAGEVVTVAIDPVGASGPDTVLELFLECGAEPVARDDDSGPGLCSRIVYPVSVTGTYRARVRGFEASTSGEYRLAASCAMAPSPPENDHRNDAYALDRCTSGALGGNASGARNDFAPVDPSRTDFSADGKDVVYRLDLLAGDTVDLLYTQREFDGCVYIVADSDADNGMEAGICIAGADTAATGEPEALHWVAETGGTYWLILDTYGEDIGAAWTLDYSITCGPSASETTSWGWGDSSLSFP